MGKNGFTGGSIETRLHGEGGIFATRAFPEVTKVMQVCFSFRNVCVDAPFSECIYPTLSNVIRMYSNDWLYDQATLLGSRYSTVARTVNSGE